MGCQTVEPPSYIVSFLMYRTALHFFLISVLLRESGVYFFLSSVGLGLCLLPHIGSLPRRYKMK
jgi:hypothetical protein